MDPEFWPLIVAFILPSNGGPITMIIGILLAICAILLVVFCIIYQIKKKMQLGILITSFILLVFYAYIGHGYEPYIIPAVITSLFFLLHWTDFFVKKNINIINK